MERKYITYDHYDGYPAYIFFDTITNHKEISGQLRAIKIHGAGFLSFREEGACCYGESVSMNIMSRGQDDEKIINRCTL
ncbi:hypothetical protein KAR91_59250 [Candidatus Pacearchaeota archaeon]|nr:hypothetical protein [Candidatus Pacearchaeota archaeon]